MNKNKNKSSLNTPKGNYDSQNITRTISADKSVSNTKSRKTKLMSDAKHAFETEIREFNDYVLLENKYLNSEYKKHVTENLNSRINTRLAEKKVYVDSLFITNIFDIQILGNKISSTGTIFFVKYKANVINVLPEKIFPITSIVSATVNSQFHGLIVNVLDLIQVLIVDGKVSNGQYCFEKCDCVLNPNIPRKINGVKVIFQRVLMKDYCVYVTGSHICPSTQTV